MDNREIYAKTEAGRDEIRTRALQLPGALRNVLLLIDGQRTLEQLKTLMAGGKAPPDAVEQLLSRGLVELLVAAPAPPPPAPAPPPVVQPPAIAPVTPPPGVAAPEPMEAEETKRFNRLYTVMNEITRDYLGLRSVFMQLKIEKCANAEELLALQDELGAQIAKAHSRAVAAELIARIQAAA
jgi:hypothetical protein